MADDEREILIINTLIIHSILKSISENNLIIEELFYIKLIKMLVSVNN